MVTPLVAYCDLTGQQVPAACRQEEKTVWLDGWLDLLYYLSCRKRDHAGQPFTWAERRASLRGRREGAYLTGDDPWPSVVQGLNVAGMLFKAGYRRVASRLART